MHLLPWRKQPRSLLGLSLHSHALCLTELTYSNQRWHLLACARQTFAADSAKLDTPELTAALSQALINLASSRKEIAIALDHSAALFKTLELDASLTEQEILLQIQAQAETCFNQPFTELMLDFTISRTASHPGLMQIRWVAVKRRLVQTWQNLLQQVGLNLVIVEINSAALQRLVCLQYALNPCMGIVHLEAESLLFMLATAKEILYVRHKPCAVTSVEKIVMAISHELQYSATTQTKLPAKIILSNPHALEPICLQQLQQHTNLPCEIANPFAALVMADSSTKCKFDKPIAAK